MKCDGFGQVRARLIDSILLDFSLKGFHNVKLIEWNLFEFMVEPYLSIYQPAFHCNPFVFIFILIHLPPPAAPLRDLSITSIHTISFSSSIPSPSVHPSYELYWTFVRSAQVHLHYVSTLPYISSQKNPLVYYLTYPFFFGQSTTGTFSYSPETRLFLN